MTRLQLVGAPAMEPVSRAEAKSFLRVDHAVDDPLVDTLISAARARCENFTGQALITQSWVLWMNDWPPLVSLAKTPVQSLTSVNVYDAAGVATAMPPGDIQLDVPTATIAPKQGKGWPPPGRARAGIEIRFVAGYGDDGAAVPPVLRNGILMTVAHLYENRGVDAAAPESALRLWQSYRQVRL